MTTTLTFDATPSLMSAYARIALPRDKRPGMPTLRAIQPKVSVDRRLLDRYAEVCGLPDAHTLALLYPHVLAAPLHAQLVAHPDFPLPAAGMVHVRNTVWQLRPIHPLAPLDLEVTTGERRSAKRGVEFDLVTEVRDQTGEVVWRGVTTALCPDRSLMSDKRADKAKAPTPSGAPSGALASCAIRLPHDAGRRYARVSGDYNPIHMWPITAKLFGFDRPIAHGMWALARGLSELSGLLPEPPCTLEVHFKRPMKLPADTLCHAWREAQDPDHVVRVAMLCAKRRAPYWEATLSATR